MVALMVVDPFGRWSFAMSWWQLLPYTFETKLPRKANLSAWGVFASHWIADLDIDLIIIMWIWINTCYAVLVKADENWAVPDETGIKGTSKHSFIPTIII